MKTGTNKKTLSLILASLLCVALTVFGIGNLSVFGNRQTKAAAGNAVAKVGETEYADLSSAFSALDANNYSLELLDEAGAFRGGIIAPGMKLGAQALARGAAQLAAVELRAPKSLLGRTTAEAMQAGIVMGEVARIDGLIDMIWADCGYTTPVVLVGQHAEAIAALMTHAVTVDQTLALRGLLELYAANTRR